MKKVVYAITAWLAFTGASLASFQACGQARFGDDRVMLQGFYWESYRHGNPRFQYGSKKWYEIVREQAGEIHDGRFDLIWLPPPSYAGESSAGYNPKQYFKLDNSYGDFSQHRAMLEALLNNGVEPVADIVINHRDGTTSWADFKNPDWGTWAICRSDEAFHRADSPLRNTPIAEQGAEEERLEYAGHSGTTYQYDSFRDLDHTNTTVRRDLLRYLLQLKSMGYHGWRYDMVHGFHAKWIALYNRVSQPTFSVGEYDWGEDAAQRGWVWHTATTSGDLSTASAVFDFRTQFTLKDNHSNYGAWYGLGNGIGRVGDTTDGHPWKNKAVTFLENHDTGYRTNEDGTPQEHHRFDNFEKGWQVEQAYAQILTHPGVPTVYWKHYFDWGDDLRNKIKALINARKVAGVHAGSALHPQNNARRQGVYGAMIEGRHGQLYVRVGGSDSDWHPTFSGYGYFREYASGTGWKVWVKLPGNPWVQQAPLKDAFPIPTYQAPETIQIPDNL